MNAPFSREIAPPPFVAETRIGFRFLGSQTWETHVIRVALRVGAVLAGGREEVVDAISRAGQALGLAFQIVDDILDVEGNLAELGKTAGSDERKQKATYPSLHGLPASKARARDLIEETKRLLTPLGPAAEPMRALADFVLERRS